jgi:hypothetical protein
MTTNIWELFHIWSVFTECEFSELSEVSLHSPRARRRPFPPHRPPRAANDEAVVGAGAAAADGDAAAGPGARLLPRRALHPVLPLRRPGCAPRFLSLPRFCTLA